MPKTKINSCGCNIFIPFGYCTKFFNTPLWYTVICVNCKKKVKARTLEKAIEKWNKKFTIINDK